MPIMRQGRSLGEIAAAHGASNAQVALAWLLSKPVVTRAHRRRVEDEPPGRRRSRRWDIKLTADEIASLEAPYLPKAVRGQC